MQKTRAAGWGDGFAKKDLHQFLANIIRFECLFGEPEESGSLFLAFGKKYAVHLGEFLVEGHDADRLVPFAEFFDLFPNIVQDVATEDPLYEFAPFEPACSLADDAEEPIGKQIVCLARSVSLSF